MKINHYNILAAFLLTCFIANAQKTSLKKADKKYNSFAYVNAIDSYEDLVAKGYTNEEVLKKLGNSNYLIANYDEAAKWYGQLIKQETFDNDPEYIYRYAVSLKSLEQYEESNQWMEKFYSLKENDLRAKNFENNRDYLKEIGNRAGTFKIEKVGFNSKESDFSPAFYGEEVLFASARDTGMVTKYTHSWNTRPFLDIYRTGGNQKEGPEKLSRNINKKTHESSPVLSNDGQTLYFTRNNSKNGGFAKDDEGVSRLKIYSATLRDGEWKNVKVLPFNGDDFSTAHPTLSPDGKWLYFASNREGTYGDSDIYKVAILENGNFGEPINLGPKINTESSETYPYFGKDGVLYFASNGHPGIGGLDLFAVKVENEEFSNIINLAMPINSVEDDFSMIIDAESGKGYFASNRSGGMGSDDIYAIQQVKPLEFSCGKELIVKVIDIENGDYLNAANVEISGERNFSAVTEQEGYITFDPKCGAANLDILAQKEGYEQGAATYSITDEEKQEITISLKPLVVLPKSGDNLLAYLNLENILFDLDKYNLTVAAITKLDKAVQFLKDNPTVNLQIRSYTDALASKSYNIKLSENRAKTTRQYLVDQGINAQRLSINFYGEENLVNDCTVWSNCSKEENHKNRRSELIVME